MVNGTLPGIPTEFFDLDFIGSTVSFALASQKANRINFSGLLRPRRERRGPPNNSQGVIFWTTSEV